MKTSLILTWVGCILLATQASAATFTEDFEAPFPTWESGWLGTNSNLQNYYGVGQGRGNNPDGLWIADGLSNGDIAEITFNPSFGNNITAFSIDITTYVSGALFEAFDMFNNTLISTTITSLFGATSDPGSYQTIFFNSSNGVSGFRITGGTIEGNTSIDNFIVTTTVPVPASLALLASGLAGIGFSRRRQKV